MILIHLCSTVQRFKHTYEKDFKTSKNVFGGHKQLNTNRCIRCATDTYHNKHYIYIKTVKLLNKHFHVVQLTLIMTNIIFISRQ